MVHPGTPPDTTLVLVGKGVRHISGDGRAGDLFVHLRVLTPTELNAHEEGLLLEFAQWRGETYCATSPHAVHIPTALAALGTTVEVSTDHGIARLRIPPGVQHGTRLGLSERPQDSSSPHEIEVKVTIPTELTSIERDLLLKFGVIHGDIKPIPTPDPPEYQGFFAWLKDAMRRAFFY
jgi:DnaJ-class molecular chaperone